MPDTETFLPEPREVASQAADPTFRRGGRLGRYVLLKPLGSGGMGNVYAAYDPELDRQVALKVLRGSLLFSKGREGWQARLRQEARLTARLAHPNVVSIYDVGQVGERIFIAMELIDGRTLSAWLQAEARTLREILDVFLQAGEGLAAAHRVGFVHRDFKPGNVMVDASGRVRVVDFGLAQPFEADRGDGERSGTASAGRSRPAEVSGTRAYLAPERREGRETDARSDQFSFCVALYEAVAGRLPRADSLEVADPWLPAWLRRPLARGLAPHPEDRFPDMPALLSALRQVSDRRRRGLGLVAAAILLSSVVVFAGLERNPSCDGGAASIAATWSTERRVAVQAALRPAIPGATGGSIPAEEDLWTRTEARLDEYARVWGEQYGDACAATHLRGEQSEAMLDRRMLCLEDRRRDFSALLSLLANADAALGGRAPRAVAALASPEICGQRKTLPPESATPADPALASQTNELRGLLAQARAEEAAGRYPQSLKVATAAAEAATELDWPPLLAEAHYQLAIANGRAGRVDELRRGLVAAARIAQAIGYGRLLAQAYNSMIIADWLQAQPESARLWGDLAAGVVQSLGSPPDLEFERRSYLSNVAEQSGRYDEMLDHSRAALELVADRPAVERGALENNLGLALYRLERRDEAEVWLTRAVESLSRDNGPEHPALAAPLHHLAMLNRERGRFDEAWAFHARSLRIGEQAYAVAYPSLLAKLLVSAAETLLAADRIAEARQRSERAVHLLEAEASVNPGELAQARYLLARALWATGEDRPQAWQLARTAEATLGSVDAPSGDLLAEIEAWLATRHPGA